MLPKNPCLNKLKLRKTVVRCDSTLLNQQQNSPDLKILAGFAILRSYETRPRVRITPYL